MSEISRSIICNGEEKKVTAQNIEQLLTELNLGEKKVAVELNQEIIPRDNYSSTRVSEGDSVEIVHFVGGG